MKKNDILTPEQIETLNSMKQYWDEVSTRENFEDIAISEVHAMMHVVNSPMKVLQMVGQFVSEEPGTDKPETKHWGVERVNPFDAEKLNVPHVLGIDSKREREIVAFIKYTVENSGIKDILNMFEALSVFARNKNEYTLMAYFYGVNQGMGMMRETMNSVENIMNVVDQLRKTMPEVPTEQNRKKDLPN